MNELCTGRWKAASEFLALPPENWPVAADMREIPEDTVYELKNAFVATVTTPPNVLPDVCRFSNWKRLICATAYVLKFIGNLRARVQGTPARDEPAITAEEQESAERLVVKTVQAESFTEDLSHLRKGRPISSNSYLRQLCPIIDENGIIRVQGRLSTEH